MKNKTLNFQLVQREAALNVIREYFASEDLRIDRIIFFGSRARGDYTGDSDWDFFIVADNNLKFKEKHRLIKLIKRKLARLGIPNDIIVQSRERFNILKNYPGNISYIANLEGVSP